MQFNDPELPKENLAPMKMFHVNGKSSSLTCMSSSDFTIFISTHFNCSLTFPARREKIRLVLHGNTTIPCHMAMYKCHAMPCRVVPCRVASGFVVSRLVASLHPMPCHVMSCGVVSYYTQIMSSIPRKAFCLKSDVTQERLIDWIVDGLINQ